MNIRMNMHMYMIVWNENLKIQVGYVSYTPNIWNICGKKA